MRVMLVKDRNVLGTKWVCNFANQLSQKGHEVHLVADSFSREGKGDYLDKSVNYTNLSRHISSKLIPSPLKYHRFINHIKPDVIICYFPTDLYNVAILKKPDAPIVMMMHNPPNEVFDKWQNKPFYKRLLSRVSVLQVLMHNFVPLAEKYYNFPKITVIPNQVMPVAPENQRDLTKENHKIIHIAQIAEQYKRQHITLEAFAKIAADFPDWTLDFYGKVKKGKHAEYFVRLLKRTKDLGLDKRVKFNGYCDDIEKVYKSADINCTPSFSEGFGYGMADGLAHGVPGIGFADAFGVNELIKDGETGFLAKDESDFSDKLKKLMSDKNLRIKMGKAAVKDMLTRYNPAIITDAWDKLIKETVK